MNTVESHTEFDPLPRDTEDNVSTIDNDFPESRSCGGRINVPYWILAYLGCGILFPWLTFMNAVDYFNHLYEGFNFEFYLSLAYMYPEIAVMFFLLPLSYRLPVGLRVVGGFGLFLVVYTLTPLILSAPFLSQRAGFVLTLIFVAISGCGDAIVQGTQSSVYGLVGSLPEMYTQALQLGTGFSGVMVAFVRIFTKWLLPETTKGLERSSMAYFIVFGALTILSIIAFLYLQSLPFMKAEMQRRREKKESIESTMHLTAADELTHSSANGSAHCEGDTESSNGLVDSVNGEGAVGPPAPPKPSVAAVMKKIWPPFLLVSFTFFLSLSLFPAAVFNVGDFIGKAAARFDVSSPSEFVTVEY